MNGRITLLLYRSVWVGLDWLFPPVCGGCNIIGTRWCLDCQNNVQPVPEPVCDSCGLPAKNNLCERCDSSRPAFKMLRSWSVFDDPVQSALHRLKYRRDMGLGEAISCQMVEFVRKLAWPVDVLVPIPLGKRRLKERGYNQVAMIAIPLALQLGIPYSASMLKRTRETRSQVGLSASQRHENMQRAFDAKASEVVGRTPLLIDDVSTTGATLSSAAEALYRSGAKDVYAITVARALPHHGLKIV